MMGRRNVHQVRGERRRRRVCLLLLLLVVSKRFEGGRPVKRVRVGWVKLLLQLLSLHPLESVKQVRVNVSKMTGYFSS